jgi:hypothetical protein
MSRRSAQRHLFPLSANVFFILKVLYMDLNVHAIFSHFREYVLRTSAHLLLLILFLTYTGDR